MLVLLSCVLENILTRVMFTYIENYYNAMHSLLPSRSYLHLIKKGVACVAGGFVREGLKLHFQQNCQLCTAGWKMSRLKNLYTEECKTAFGRNNKNS